MRSLIQLAVGLATAVAVALLFGARMMLDIVGYTTAPDDYALLKQRLPKMFEWLFSTPWWVPSLLMVVLVALSAWLIVSGTKKATAEEIADHPGLSEEAIATLIDARLPSLDDYAKHSHLHEHDVQLADLADKIKFVRGMAEGGHESVDARFKKIEEKLDRLIAYAEQRTGELSERFANVDNGFAAISNREWHQRLFAELERDFAGLAEPINVKEAISDPGKWQMLVANWRGKLDQWLMIADFYAMNTRENVLMIPEHLYYGKWDLAEDKLTADQVKMFKEVSIWWRSAKAAKPRVDQCLAGAAFEVPSKKGRPDSPPRPSAGQ